MVDANFGGGEGCYTGMNVFPTGVEGSESYLDNPPAHHIMTVQHFRSLDKLEMTLFSAPVPPLSQDWERGRG
jgi:hypothetical protein